MINKGNLKALASQFDHWILDNSVKISALVNRLN
ncbi:hypothetical protein ACT44D_18440 (plasmid) [Acinetobacter baumannii]